MNLMPFLIRIVVCFVVAEVLTVAVSRGGRKKNAERTADDYQVGLFECAPLFLIVVILIPLVVSVICGDGMDFLTTWISYFFNFLLETVVVFSILGLVMPRIRERTLSSTSLSLWAIPAGMLCAVYTLNNGFKLDTSEPWLRIVLEGTVVRAGTVVWLLGFVTLMTWAIASHVVYRKHLLKDSYPAELAIRQRWKMICKEMGSETDYPLVVSPAAETPLTIGLFMTSICVVLPEREYAPEELELILRHELIHILRKDNQLKLYMVFYRALFWFNPLMWRAMKLAAEDTELACDELVLEEASEEERMRYASLVLSTVGDPRGFSTCLSANASSLRYRLRMVVTPTVRKKGLGYIMLLFFVILLTYGRVALAYSPTGNTTIFGEEVTELPGADQVESIWYEHSGDETVIGTIKKKDLKAGVMDAATVGEMCDYLFSLNYCITTEESPDEWEKQLNVNFKVDKRRYMLYLEDQFLTYYISTGREDGSFEQGKWYISDPVDWGYLESLIPEQAMEIVDGE